MDASSLPPREDETDRAIHDLLVYLVLTDVVEGDLNAIAPAIRRVVLELLLREEAAGALTPYRRHLLEVLRARKA